MTMRASGVDRVDEYNVSLRMVAECRKIHGRKAAARLWKKLGLPNVGRVDEELLADGFDPDDSLGRFLVGYVRWKRGSRIQASLLYAAFDAWCRERGEVSLSQRGFSFAMFKRGYTSKKSNKVWFVGIEMIPSA